MLHIHQGYNKNTFKNASPWKWHILSTRPKKEIVELTSSIDDNEDIAFTPILVSKECDKTVQEHQVGTISQDSI